MELARGICTLCSENTKVLPLEATEEFTKHLPAVLYENFLPESQFQKIKPLIKACAICCYRIQLAVETKALHRERDDDEIVSEDTCHFCQADKCLVKVDRHWKYFSERAQGFFNPVNLPICACPRCVFYFDTIFNFKTKLSYKFPQLVTQKKKASGTPQKHDTPQKENETPKRKKSTSKSPPSSKKRKIFDNCFAYLQPLCNNTYQVDSELKHDKRLYRKVAYVNLTNSKDIYVKETPKTRPVIKIKLKPKHKRSDGGKSRPFVVVSKSEEIPKKERHRTKRRHSAAEGKESSEEPQESVDETPKSASVSNLVPKRRVSDYIDNSENEEKKETLEESSAVKENEKEDENESENKEEQTESPESVSDEDKTPPSPAEPKESTETDENGIDKPNEEMTEIAPSSEENASGDVVNGEVLNNATENDEYKDEHEPKEAAVDDNASDISSSNSSRKSPSKSDGDSDGNDSDTNTSDPKDINHDTSQETDVLNGSERKKKKVTFSDEVNN